ncbi:unnamed protein product [Psylliodes chrysocephalus]|uniref:Uncharacterized protein n=1 Tax=Psylliodes chrysocephalus TaxID=3402493 RepID=A0A9P0CZN5_9CUCU|nr:unnamed protein product [Psylliodes chrysocephala]
MVRPVQSVTLLPVLLVALCKLVVTVPVETVVISIPSGNANDSVVATPAKGDSVSDLGNSVPIQGNSNTNTDDLVPDKGNSVPDKDNSDPNKGNSASATPAIDNSIRDKGNSVPDKSNSISKYNRDARDDSAVSASNAAASNGTEDDSVPVSTGPIEYYKTKYDHVDIEALLNNRRMVNYYTKCMLNQAPCPPDGAEFKRILPDAIRTNCRRCTEKQKSVTIRAVKRLMKEYPKTWMQLAKAWDPKDIYVKKFISTYSSWEYEPVTTPKNIFANRFDDGDDENNPNKLYSNNSNNILFNIPPLPTIPPKVLDRVEPFANGIGAGFTATIKMVKTFEKSLWQMAGQKFRILNRILGG